MAQLIDGSVVSCAGSAKQKIAGSNLATVNELLFIIWSLAFWTMSVGRYVLIYNQVGYFYYLFIMEIVHSVQKSQQT
jgi:hypothetical protein